MNDERKDRTLILGAMRGETELLIAALENAEECRKGEFYFYSGTIHGKNVTVGRCLVGTAYSAAAAALAIERYAPEIVITCGTAGGHDPALHRGDIVLGGTVINASRYNAPHRDAGTGCDCFGWTIPDSDCFEEGGHRSCNVLKADEKLIRAALSLEHPGGRTVVGTVLSGDAWNRELDRILHYHNTYGSSCEDMESFAVAEICSMYGLPWLSVRIISNSENHPEETMDLVSSGEDCQKFVLALVEKL